MQIGDEKIRFWCQQILPLVYDDSLSYYEVLSKIVDYINNNIEDVQKIVEELNNFEEEVDTNLDEIREELTALSERISGIIDDSVESTDSTYSSAKIVELISGIIDDSQESEETTYSSAKISDELDEKTNLSDIAEEFDSTKTYRINNFVIYNGKFYRCVTQHTGAWSDFDFIETTVAEVLGISEENIALMSDLKLDCEAIAPIYDEWSTFAIGDYCTHQGRFYKCVTAISEGEEWNSAHWTEVQIIDVISYIVTEADEVFSGENPPTSSDGNDNAIYIQYGSIGVSDFWVKANGTWYKILSWEGEISGYIQLASGLTAAQVGNYGENAYIYVNKPDDSASVYFEWDIDFLSNYTDILNLNNLGGAFGGGSGIISNYCIPIGGNLATGDNCQGSIYNLSVRKIDDVWKPIIGITNAAGYRPNENIAEYQEISLGRRTYFLGDSYYHSNRKKFDLFGLCNCDTGAEVASRWRDWFLYAPSHYTPFYRLYGLKIWSDANKTTLLHNYTPTIRNGHKGVYDSISEVFYPCSNDDFFEIAYDTSDIKISFINDNVVSKVKTWSSKKISDELTGKADAYTDVIGVLVAGSTSITLTSDAITANSTINVYTDNGTDWNSITVSTGSVTLTFDAQNTDLNVKVRVS